MGFEIVKRAILRSEAKVVSVSFNGQTRFNKALVKNLLGMPHVTVHVDKDARAVGFCFQKAKSEDTLVVAFGETSQGTLNICKAMRLNDWIKPGKYEPEFDERSNMWIIHMDRKIEE